MGSFVRQPAKNSRPEFTEAISSAESCAERIEDGRLAQVQVDVWDYGPTVTEAMRALDAHFDAWRRAHPNTGHQLFPFFR